MNNFNMSLTTTSDSPQVQQQQQHPNVPLLKRREREVSRGNLRAKMCQQYLLTYSVISIFVVLCWVPDFIVALKDVSVTIPQAVKRGSNAMLTCNYDMENDTLYSVKWYKGRREFYRYTPKENPAMKVFPSQSGLNVERNLSNQSHVVLLAVPLNISGKFTCEISVEAPSFQTAMVSGEMEVVELPEEQATVTGIQPRYRIGDLVDGNCSIKYSKPAANLTWTINGIVVPPHHIKTYQIEKYDEMNLESVMSAIHFMVTTHHFVKGQMRLKCTASIFDIFKEEIESIIEEDRPRIMASGQSYPPDHGYGVHGESDGYEHNESYLTYFSAPKSSASPSAEFVMSKVVKNKFFKNLHLLFSEIESYTQYILTTPYVNNFKNNLAPSNLIKIKNTYYNVLQLIVMKAITTTLVILLIMFFLQIRERKVLQKNLRKKRTQDKQLAFNCNEMFSRLARQRKENFLAIKLWQETQYRGEEEQKKANESCYQDANDDDRQSKCGQREQYQHGEHCLVANQNVVNEKVFLNDTNINTISKNSKNKSTITAIDCQHHMSQALDVATLPPTLCASKHLPPTSSFSSSSLRSSTSTSTSTSTSASTSTLPKLSSSFSSLLSLPLPSSSASSLSLSSTLGHTKTNAHDSFPLCAAVYASKSNNAKYMSKDQTLLMTFTPTAANTVVVFVAHATSNSLCKIPSAFVPITVTTTVRALVLESKLLHTSVRSSMPVVEMNSSPSQVFSRNNYLMVFIGELLLHRC